MIEMGITENYCGMSRYVGAYKTYSSDTALWDEWLGDVEDEDDDVNDDSLTAPAAIGLMLAVLAWK